MSALGFTTPWLLAALAVLPVLWWLLRVTPPAARSQLFPAVTLLLGLEAHETTPARTPWWLLLLRLVAAGLLIVGLAGPERGVPHPLAGGGPLLVVIDNGWAAAPDWPERLRAARSAIDSAATAATPLRLLLTADEPDGQRPALGPRMTRSEARSRLAAAQPQPWPPDRGAAATALAEAPAASRVIYVADGLAADAAGDARFARALGRFAQVSELLGDIAPRLLRPPVARTDQLGLRGQTLPGHPGQAQVRAVDAAGTTLAQTTLDFDAAGAGRGALVLPPDLRNRVASLRLAGQVSAGGVALLDEGSRRRPVGLLAQGSAQNEPLTGALFYLRRALSTHTELRGGDLPTVLKSGVSVIMMADERIGDPAVQAALIAWVRHGGVLVRFAGPNLAGQTVPDPLLPVVLLAGDRSLGGAMSWSRPAALAPFPAGSPFAGLALPGDVRVTRQVLAQPGDAPDRPGRQDWAMLADGTPLVTAAPLGAGRLVLFHVTANADWSNLPLSGLFPQMLQRLVALSVGVRTPAGDAKLAPRRALDGLGQLGTPGPAATALTTAAIATTIASPAHPPGLYGPDDATTAFNLGASLPALAAAAIIPGASLRSLAGAPLAQSYGQDLIALALVLLGADMLIALALRGLLTATAALLLISMPLGTGARAQAVPAMPSLATHLAYILTGDAQADSISLAGLHGLSTYANERTSAVLADPVGVDPSHDDLSFYPLLYWPILSDAPVPDGATLARLDDYMENGGIILFDTRDAGAPDPGAENALRQIGLALSLPPLTPLRQSHVLTHTFYLLHDEPGRWDGGTVYVASGAERSNDGVSPVILGSNDWAAAWATDAAGDNPYAVSPGGDQQRVLAYRFGVNLVMYALTGNYKADQVHVPELLRRLGGDAQDAPP
jgi:hypothetical protein